MSNPHLAHAVWIGLGLAAEIALGYFIYRNWWR